MHFICNATFGSKIYHSLHHITTTSHHKTHVFGAFKHFCSSFHEIFRTFLHCNTTKEGNQFLFAWSFHKLLHIWYWVYCIVYCSYLCRVLMIFFYHCAASKVAHANNMVGNIHTTFFNAIHSWVHLSTTTVEIGSMHVNNKWFTSNLFCKNTCRIS